MDDDEVSETLRFLSVELTQYGFDWVIREVAEAAREPEVDRSAREELRRLIDGSDDLVVG